MNASSSIINIVIVASGMLIHRPYDELQPIVGAVNHASVTSSGGFVSARSRGRLNQSHGRIYRLGILRDRGYFGSESCSLAPQDSGATARHSGG